MAAGYACTRAAASLGAWDIIGIGSTSETGLQHASGLSDVAAKNFSIL
jgi:hypothetical protein